ncbi:MAG: enoyl-CoA hydratase/isomerase family protein [Chloroflexi bacterium]|nr:enoyl-CoA hydratase/isomerase family protein [Chloroflexota bacterium]
MPEPLVLLERRGPVGLARLNRPGKLNALSPDMLRAIADSLEELDGDDQVRAIVLTGSEKVFAAGADIEVLARATPQDIEDMNTRQYWRRFQAVRKPVIAAVSGFAFGGGCELALQCDLIVASETARFAQPEIKLGIMPGGGGTQRLAKVIGPYKAMELILTGEPITARQAYAWNLVNRVVPVERYLEEALELAALIAERPPLAVKAAREALRFGVEHTLTQGLDVERAAFVDLFATADQKEGMAAFLEKRPPEFKGE